MTPPTPDDHAAEMGDEMFPVGPALSQLVGRRLSPATVWRAWARGPVRLRTVRLGRQRLTCRRWLGQYVVDLADHQAHQAEGNPCDNRHFPVKQPIHGFRRAGAPRVGSSEPDHSVSRHRPLPDWTIQRMLKSAAGPRTSMPATTQPCLSTERRRAPARRHNRPIKPWIPPSLFPPQSPVA